MNNTLSNLLLKTSLLSVAMLVCLSVSMWLMAQYNPDTGQYKNGLIHSVQASANNTPNSTLSSPNTTAQQTLSSRTNAHLTAHVEKTAFIQSIDIDETQQTYRVVLQFAQPQVQADRRQTDDLRHALQQLSISRHARIRITAGAFDTEQRIHHEQQLKLRTQAIARIAFAYTQNVEIVLGKTLPEVGMVALDIDLLKKPQNSSDRLAER